MSGDLSTPAKATTREWIGLAVLALPTLLVSLDTFVMLLALPAISADLGASSTEQLWIMDIYGFMVAGFMITMGTLGDRIGRRRLLLIGAAVFGVASVIAAYSNSPGALIGARTLLGIAGAALTPSTLSLISTLFRDPRQRGTAIGIWAGCFTAGAILGPIVGGVMLQHFWWGSVLLLGVPAMVLLLAVGPRLLPEYRDDQAGRLDPVSVCLSLATTLPVVYGLKELARTGWHPALAALVVAGLVAGLVFVLRQLALADPLIDVRLFTRGVFNTSLVSMLAYSMLSGGTMVFVAQYFQLVDGLTPLGAALALMPGMAASVLSFQVSPLLARRLRPAILLPLGLAVSVAGLLVMTQASPPSGRATLITGFVLASMGAGPLLTLGIGLVMGSAPPEKAGAASGIAQTTNEFGYALGIAVLGSVFTAVYRAEAAAHLPAGAPAAAKDSLGAAAEAVRNLPGQLGESVRAAAEQSFATGLHTVAAISAIALAGIAVLIRIMLRHLDPIGHDADGPAGSDDLTVGPPPA